MKPWSNKHGRHIAILYHFWTSVLSSEISSNWQSETYWNSLKNVSSVWKRKLHDPMVLCKTVPQKASWSAKDEVKEAVQTWIWEQSKSSSSQGMKLVKQSASNWRVTMWWSHPSVWPHLVQISTFETRNFQFDTRSASNWRVTMWRSDKTIMYICAQLPILRGMLPLLFDSPLYLLMLFLNYLHRNFLIASITRQLQFKVMGYFHKNTAS